MFTKHAISILMRAYAKLPTQSAMMELDPCSMTKPQSLAVGIPLIVSSCKIINIFQSDIFLVTRTCEVDQLCYKSALRLEEYINTPSVWDKFDVPKHIHNFSVLSNEVVSAFSTGNDLYINTMPEVKFVLENEVDVLIYNGNLDLACNSAGNFRWTSALSWNGQAEFTSQDMQPWFSEVDGAEVEAGKFRDVHAYGKKGAGKKSRFAFVTIYNSGHMVSTPSPELVMLLISSQVPLDQPQIALDLMQRWISGRKFE